MMIGASALRAASRHALTDEEVTQLTAGSRSRASARAREREREREWVSIELV